MFLKILFFSAVLSAFFLSVFPTLSSTVKTCIRLTKIEWNIVKNSLFIRNAHADKQFALKFAHSNSNACCFSSTSSGIHFITLRVHTRNIKLWSEKNQIRLKTDYYSQKNQKLNAAVLLTNIFICCQLTHSQRKQVK